MTRKPKDSKIKTLCILIIFYLFLFACNKEDPPGNLFHFTSSIEFGNVGMNAPSESRNVNISCTNITKELTAAVSGDFEISIDDDEYGTELIIDALTANKGITIKIRCAATMWATYKPGLPCTSMLLKKEILIFLQKVLRMTM